MLSFKIANIIKKAKLVFISDTSKKLQKCQLTVGENQPIEAVRLQQSGISSNPEKGSESIVVSISGDLSDAICITIDDSRVRPQVENGDTCLYNPSASQSKIFIKKDGILLQANGPVTVDGNLVVKGSVTADSEICGSDVKSGDVYVSDIIRNYNAHSHGNGGADAPKPPIGAV